MADHDYGTLSERKYLVIHDPKTHLAESPKERFLAIIFGGSLLSFNAGFINVISLLISNVLVSHTTGNITKSAITLTEGEYFSFLEVSVMLPCFVLGSFITTMLIDQRTFHLTKQFNVVFLICTILLTLASFVGVYTTSRQLYAYLATLACGMQNALTTKYSGSIIRTTHTTGMATDIGICLGRIVKGKPNEVWKLQVQLPLLCSFFAGGVAGALAHKELGKYTMFICAGLSASIAVLYVVTLAYTRQESLYTAAFGKDDDIYEHTVISQDASGVDATVV